MCILGDLTFECTSASGGGYLVFRNFAVDHGFVCCDTIENSGIGYTYHRDTVRQSSFLDHTFRDDRIMKNVVCHSTLDDISNPSDYYNGKTFP